MRNTTQAVRQAIIVVSLLAGGASLALAHHSYSAFEMAGTRVITGTIKKMDWTNPHTWIWLDVPNEKGGSDRWGVEGMSPNYLGRRGWTRTTFKPGDKATIVVHPAKDGSPGGIFVRATLANGRTLTFGANDPPEPVTQR